MGQQTLSLECQGLSLSWEVKLVLTPRKMDRGSEVSVRQRTWRGVVLFAWRGSRHWAGPEGNRSVTSEELSTDPRADSALGDNCTK